MDILIQSLREICTSAIPLTARFADAPIPYELPLRIKYICAPYGVAQEENYHTLSMSLVPFDRTTEQNQIKVVCMHVRGAEATLVFTGYFDSIQGVQRTYTQWISDIDSIAGTEEETDSDDSTTSSERDDAPVYE